MRWGIENMEDKILDEFLNRSMRSYITSLTDAMERAQDKGDTLAVVSLASQINVLHSIVEDYVSVALYEATHKEGS